MRKFLLLFIILTVSLLVACQESPASDAATSRAPEAFQALQDDVRGNVVIKDVDYACIYATFLDKAEETCMYIIQYTTASGTGTTYAYVFVSGETDKEGSTLVDLFSLQETYLEQLDVIHSQQLKDVLTDGVEEEADLQDYDFISGTFTQAEINKAMQSVE